MEMGDGSHDQDRFKDRFMMELTQWDLGRIRTEPGRQAAEQTKLQEDIQQLAINNYRQFLETSSCLSRCRTRTLDVDQSLSSLHGIVSKLSTKIKSLSEKNASQNSDMEIQANLSECYPHLVDILDIPFLMETCIAEGSYDSALDLRDHAKTLLRRNPDIKIISYIALAVDKATDILLQDLLKSLETVIQLPISLQTIAYIRRIDSICAEAFIRFTEAEIRMQFLQRRETWLESSLALESLRESSPLVFTSKYLDLIRVHLFEIVTQFQAMFADDDKLLHLWVSHRLTAIFGTLQTQLPKITNGSSVATLLEQAMYCGMSLGAIGIDFRAILVPIFSQHILMLFSRSMDTALESFTSSLTTHAWFVDEAMLSKLGIGVQGERAIEVPVGILNFPPLAILIRSLFNAIEQARECLPLNLIPDIANSLQETLVRCCQQLVLLASEQNIIPLCQAFGDMLLPCSVTAFSTLFPEGSYEGSPDQIDIDFVLTNLRSAGLYSDEQKCITITLSDDDDGGDDNDAATPDMLVVNS